MTSATGMIRTKKPRQSTKTSAATILQFKDGEITVKRMGTKDYVNLVELKNN